MPIFLGKRCSAENTRTALKLGRANALYPHLISWMQHQMSCMRGLQPLRETDHSEVAFWTQKVLLTGASVSVFSLNFYVRSGVTPEQMVTVAQIGVAKRLPVVQIILLHNLMVQYCELLDASNICLYTGNYQRRKIKNYRAFTDTRGVFPSLLQDRAITYRPVSWFGEDGAAINVWVDTKKKIAYHMEASPTSATL